MNPLSSRPIPWHKPDKQNIERKARTSDKSEFGAQVSRMRRRYSALSSTFVSIAFDPVYAIVSAECEPDLLVYCLYQLIVDRYLIYLKLHLFWEFTRVKIGVAYIKVTVGCDGRRLILKTLFSLAKPMMHCTPDCKLKLQM